MGLEYIDAQNHINRLTALLGQRGIHMAQFQDQDPLETSYKPGVVFPFAVAGGLFEN